MAEVKRVNGGMDEMRPFWGWFLSLGVALITLGLICFIYSLTATVSTLSLFGWLLLIGGVLGFMPAFRTGTWRGFLFYLVDGLLSMFTGFLFISYPAMRPSGLTVTLATFLIVVGLSRAIGAGTAKFAHYGWAISSGLVTMLLGCIAIGWCSYWYAGFAIGADMIFGGVAMVGFAIGLRGTPRHIIYGPA